MATGSASRAGYVPELKRTLGGFALFAISFAFISVAVGVFATCGLMLNSAGPVEIWPWVIAATGQTLVALAGQPVHPDPGAGDHSGGGRRCPPDGRTPRCSAGAVDHRGDDSAPLIYGAAVVLYLTVRQRLERREGGFSLGRFELPVAFAALFWVVFALFVLVTPADALVPGLVVLGLILAGGVYFAKMLFFNREVLETEPGDAIAIRADLANLEAVDELVETVGPVDVLINNAARSIRRPLAESLERWHDVERVMALNYFAPLRLIRGLAPGMIERGDGHVINVATWRVLPESSPMFAAYNASKAALSAVSRVIDTEWGRAGVHSTTIYYPLVATPMIARAYDGMAALSADEAADWMVTAAKTRPIRIAPRKALALRALDGVAPRLLNGILERETSRLNARALVAEITPRR